MRHGGVLLNFRYLPLTQRLLLRRGLSPDILSLGLELTRLAASKRRAPASWKACLLFYVGDICPPGRALYRESLLAPLQLSATLHPASETKTRGGHYFSFGTTVASQGHPTTTRVSNSRCSYHEQKHRFRTHVTTSFSASCRHHGHWRHWRTGWGRSPWAGARSLRGRREPRRPSSRPSPNERCTIVRCSSPQAQDILRHRAVHGWLLADYRLDHGASCNIGWRPASAQSPGAAGSRSSPTQYDTTTAFEPQRPWLCPLWRGKRPRVPLAFP